MIKQHIEQLIRTLENEMSQKIDEKKKQITSEKITPYNMEIDKSRDNAIEQKRTEAQAEIEAIKRKFEEDKKAIEDAAIKEKVSHEKKVIEESTYEITTLYLKHISMLKDQIQDMGE